MSGDFKEGFEKISTKACKHQDGEDKNHRVVEMSQSVYLLKGMGEGGAGRCKRLISPLSSCLFSSGNKAVQHGVNNQHSKCRDSEEPHGLPSELVVSFNLIKV